MAGGTFHPLDPLSPVEIKAAAGAIKAAAAQKKLKFIRFNTITLQEPPKQELLAYDDGRAGTPRRQAFVIVQFWPQVPVVEAVVDLSSSRPSVANWVEVKNVQPLATPDDCELAETIAKADPGVQAMLRERGITRLDLVACDPWSVNESPVEGRVIQLFMYMRSHPDDNHYAHPLDFTPIADLNHKKILRIDKHYDVPQEVPELNVNYHRNLMEQEWRTDIKPLNVVQPEGPSFTVEGNLVRWQKWHIRISFNAREGLVLHNVGYEANGRIRPIMHRASLVEMAVPYADPNPPYHRKMAMDVGDYSIGFCANSLELGCDCLGSIQYFDAVLNDSKGEPWEIKKAVCLHEEDAGLLWKHMEYRTGFAESRRSRRLVLSFISTVVNYEYAFYWYFGQDGSIEYEIKLTGELSTNQLTQGEGPDSKYGCMVAPGVNAQHHQHLFCARLDMAVDDPNGGAPLVVVEQDFEPIPAGPKNPYGNAFIAKETPLVNEIQAQRVADASKGRMWKFTNPESLHPVTGKPVAYKLVLPQQPTMFAQPGCVMSNRALFARKNIWVTPHSDDERWPAGDYTICSTGGEGLPKWTKQGRPVAGNDPVLWLCFGISHAVRVEDFPVMPCEKVGWHLKPSSFFGGNPGVDIPPSVNGASTSASTPCCRPTNRSTL